MTLGWFDVARDLLGSFGGLVRFVSKVMGDICKLRVFKYFGEVLRQASILVLGSAVVVCGLMFMIGLTCGVESAYFNRSTGSPSYAGVFSAWCDLREAAPYAFGYMMAAKVGTGLVAEIGAMRVTEEIDALEVMGIDSLAYLCATRLVATWMTVPFMYLFGIGASYLASYLAVVIQVGDTSSGGFSLIFWSFQNPLDLVFSLFKGLAMATLIVIVGCYYGYTASGGAVGVGRATAKSMVLNAVGVHVIGMAGTQLFWGANPRAPIGG
jgi:phospholipid/cholesterol/gamma-HCH transport system permease protein